MTIGVEWWVEVRGVDIVVKEEGEGRSGSGNSNG